MSVLARGRVRGGSNGGNVTGGERGPPGRWIRRPLHHRWSASVIVAFPVEVTDFDMFISMLHILPPEIQKRFEIGS